MSVNTILSDVGNFFKKVFTSPVVQDIEKEVDVFAQTPFASLLLGPAGATLLKNSVESIENIEMASIAAGMQSGTGTQKAAAVASLIAQDYTAFAESQNPPLPVTPASLQAFINAMVAVANSFPAGTIAPVTTGTTSVGSVPATTPSASAGTLL